MAILGRALMLKTILIKLYARANQLIFVTCPITAS